MRWVLECGGVDGVRVDGVRVDGVRVERGSGFCSGERLEMILFSKSQD